MSKLQDSVAAQSAARPIPSTEVAHPPEEGLEDGALGRAMAFGFSGGTFGMWLLTVGMCLLGGASLGVAAAIAIVPGLVAGFFFGGTAWMSSEVLKLEHRSGGGA